MGRRIGLQTVEIESKPRIISTYNIVGPKEGQGPLKEYFDKIIEDDLNGTESFEKAETSLLYTAISESIKKAKLKEADINYLLAGDLLNQLSSSCFAARDLDIPFIGLYGACSTMAESLSIASMIMEGGLANHVVAATSSHFSSAERQFRLPLEMGSQRAPTAQWTVTGAGSMVLGKKGKFPYVTHITTGKVKDYGIIDVNNMGVAMAPAAVDTIKQHFMDTGRKPSDYDLIATGDLGIIGKEFTEKLLLEYKYDMRGHYIDCGEIIFDASRQGTNAGGSGCGCSAVVATGYLLKNMIKGKFKRILLVSTGALLSPTSTLQGETIPGIAHAVSIEFGGE
ncbi:stage V sporulation protein AD [Clostridium estertheticum]|uniref:stage V sporulation protein AD n=1 Tax=Clostridium estertheticum TaxID=238834 RepID=UPI001C7D3F18|nr:stage V sporulation protein AD [Clostridium estertheticum]MBX4259949.1 stage V sporulation protein AD [Clostridium estertheticum]WLC72412.1 stage V sporulation protein AD [Clostridium estertheticum]